MSTPRRLVIVDDDPKVRLLLERAFRAPEWEAHTFAAGSAALAKIEEIRPDCVVSDILMPDMDGETFLRGVRSRPGLARLPFVVVSAVRSESRIQGILDAGANAFLLKPFPLRQLLDKVRSLVDPARAREARGERTADDASPTGPVVAAAHTVSTAAVRRPSPAGGDTAPAVRLAAPIRIVVPPSPPVAAAPGPRRAAVALARHVEVRPPEALGFGRYTRVELHGRSIVVLTEVAEQPRFTVTTVVTENGVPLRRLESALPHSLAREDDRETVRRQLDLQHEGVLESLEQVLLTRTPRRVVWSDQNRSVEAGLLAWAMSAVAQLVETETGTEETARILQSTRERLGVTDGALRAFHVTPLGRVIVDPDHPGQLPRRGVRAVADWCQEVLAAALPADRAHVVERVRQATRRYAAQLERLGFYERLQRKTGT